MIRGVNRGKSGLLQRFGFSGEGYFVYLISVIVKQ